MKYVIFTLFSFFLLLGFSAQSQGFLMNRLFKPGIKIGAEYQPDQLLGRSHSFDVGRSRFGLTIPIKSKLGIALKPTELDLEEVLDFKNWKKIPVKLTKVIQPKAHQIFWNVNVYYNYLHEKNSFIPGTDIHYQFRSHLVGANTGVTGFHYLRKARVLFYAGNVGFLEDRNAISELRPTANALVGFAQVTSLHSILYLGGYVAYADKRVVPVPILGFDTRLAKRLRLNVTLPVQVKLTYKKKKNRYSVLTTLSGFQGGFSNYYTLSDERLPFTFSYLKSGFEYNRKIGKKSRFVMATGWASWRRDFLGDPINLTNKEKGSPYVEATFYRKFGKSLFDSSIGNFLN